MCARAHTHRKSWTKEMRKRARSTTVPHTLHTQRQRQRRVSVCGKITYEYGYYECKIHANAILQETPSTATSFYSGNTCLESSETDVFDEGRTKSKPRVCVGVFIISSAGADANRVFSCAHTKRAYNLENSGVDTRF